MPDIIALTGLVVTDLRHLTTSEGLPITSFRLASTSRKLDRATQTWVDGETNFYTVTCFRRLATNVAASVEKGHRVVVIGRLRIKEWQAGERTGLNIEIDADAVGPDLAWGTAQYTRTVTSSRRADADAPAAAEAAGDAAVEPDESARVQEPVPVPF